jgi:hypothetical protein
MNLTRVNYGVVRIGVVNECFLYILYKIQFFQSDEEANYIIPIQRSTRTIFLSTLDERNATGLLI